MEEVLFELLKQSAVVIALGVGNWAQWKEKKELQTTMMEMAKEHKEREIKWNESLQANNTENTEALTYIRVAMEAIKDNLKNE